MLTLDLDIYRRWLLAALASYPDTAVAQGTELVIDGYDVVTKQEYPTPESLASTNPEGYDVVMLTGSSEWGVG